MLTQLRTIPGANVPLRPESVNFVSLHGPENAPFSPLMPLSLEELAVESQLASVCITNLLADAPGLHDGGGECCRTDICTCTRAVPHGSFL
jgi:hypothetical protein